MSLLPLYYAFAAPVGFILLVNVILFVMIAVNLCRSGRGLKSNQPKKQRHIRNLQAAMALFFLLGLLL